MRYSKRLLVAVLALSAAVALAACGGGGDDGTGTGTSGEAEAEAIAGSFEPVADAPSAYSGVGGEADLERAGGGTEVSISLSGLEPKTAYVAHLHVGGCGQADPGGPHFQFEKGGPEEPPNEIHLRFTTDAAGEGSATASSGREVPPGEAGSVVVHTADDGTSGEGHMDDDHKGGDDKGGDQMGEGGMDDHHEMSAHDPGEATAASAVLVHEGHSHSEKVACAELEGGGGAASGGEAAGGEVPTIVIRGGEPVGGVQELEFNAGDEIRFRVSSDEAEEVHVHGYDIAEDVPAGGTIEFDFPADIEGIFEAELEEKGVQIAELRVNP